jgi:DNA-binding protein HU-beta
MNKSDLVNVVAAKAEITKKSADKAVSALFEAIKENVAAKNRVQIAGFGSFEARSRAARKGKNPQTGAEINIPAATVPAFRAGKAFKEATNGKKKTAAKKTPAAKKTAPKAKKK